MSTNIGELDIQITANATRANNALDDLADSLSKLQNASSNSNGLNNVSVGLKNISTAMQGMKNVASRDFTTLTKGIEKITNINTGNLQNVASQLTPLSDAIDKFSRATIDTKGISSFATALSKLGNVKFENSNNFGMFSAELTKLINALNGVEGVNSKITSFVNALAKLANAGENTLDTANGLKPLQNELIDFFNAMNSVSSINSEVRMFVSSLGQLASAGSKTQTTADGLKRLSQSVKQFAVDMQSLPELSGKTLSLLNSLSGLSQSGNKLGGVFSKVNNSASKTPSLFNKTSISTKGLSSAIGMLYAKYWMLIRVFGKLKSAITSAMDYIEDFNYYDVAINKVSEDYYKEAGFRNAKAYKESYEKNLGDLNKKLTGMTISKTGELGIADSKSLGLDVSEIVAYEAKITQLTNSIGMLGTGSEAASKGMAMLSADISSLTNTDLSQVQDNLVSGISGMTMAVRKYGIDISNATLKQYALEYGITKNVSAMTQAEKTYLRMLAILDQSKISYGDLAKTINQPANQFRLLKNNIKQCGMMLGRLFMPIIQKVFPWINAMAMAIRDLIKHIGDLFGIKWSEASNAIKTGTDVDFETTEDGLDGVADKIDKTTDSAKKLNKQLQGFDELNNLTSSVSSGSDNGTSGVGSGSDVSGMLNSALIDAVEDYKTRWDKAFDGMTSKADELKKKIEEVFLRDWKLGDFTDVGVWVGDHINKLVEGFDPKKAADGVTRLATSIETFLIGAISEVNWKLLGYDIAKFFGNIDYAKIGIKFIYLAGAILKGMADAIDGMIKGLKDSNPISVALIGLLGAVKLTGADKALAKVLSASLAGANLSLGKIALGLSLGYATFKLMQSDSEIQNLVAAPITAALAGYTLTHNLKLSLKIATVTLAWEGGVKFGKWLGEQLFGVEDDWSFYDYDIKEWWEALKEWILDVIEATGLLYIDIGLAIATPYTKIISLVKSIIKQAGNFLISIGLNISTSTEKLSSNVNKVIKQAGNFLIGIALSISTSNEKLASSVKGLINKIGKFTISISAKLKGITKSTVKTWLKPLQEGANKLITMFNELFHIKWSAVKIAGQTIIPKFEKQLVSIPKINLFAKGGFPNVGEMFIAREAGAEMVGRLGNKTAVANNQQIERGISDAVYNALVPVLTEVANSINNMGNNNTLFVEGVSDGDIVRIVERENRNFVKRTGRPLFSN